MRRSESCIVKKVTEMGTVFTKESLSVAEAYTDTQVDKHFIHPMTDISHEVQQ